MQLSRSAVPSGYGQVISRVLYTAMGIVDAIPLYAVLPTGARLVEQSIAFLGCYCA